MRNIDVNRVIDNARFTPFHWNVLFWCTLIIIFDGYDRELAFQESPYGAGYQAWPASGLAAAAESGWM